MDRDAWLEQRRTGIGGSDVAALFGLHPWQTSYGLWLDKRGELDDAPENAACRLGRLLEPEIRRWYEHNSAGVEWREEREMAWLGGTRDPSCPIFANTDGELRLLSGTRAVWEAKAVLFPGGKRRWAGGVPAHVVLQVQLYMLVTGLDAALVVACWGFHDDGNLDCDAFLVDASPRIQAGLQRVVAGWWQRHIVDGHPPDATGRDVGALLAQDRSADPCALGWVHDMMAGRCATIRDERKALQEEYDDIRARVLQAMGDSDHGQTPEGRIWRVSNGRMYAPRG